MVTDFTCFRRPQIDEDSTQCEPFWWQKTRDDVEAKAKKCTACSKNGVDLRTQVPKCYKSQ